MKIHADKIEGSPPHALSARAVRCLLRAVPKEWIEGLAEVRLSNSIASAPRVFFSRSTKTLTVHARGASPRHAAEMILLELVAVNQGYATRHWHRLSTSEQASLEKRIQPYLEELFPTILPSPRRFVDVPTPAFRRVF